MEWTPSKSQRQKILSGEEHFLTTAAKYQTHKLLITSLALYQLCSHNPLIYMYIETIYHPNIPHQLLFATTFKLSAFRGWGVGVGGGGKDVQTTEHSVKTLNKQKECQ